MLAIAGGNDESVLDQRLRSLGGVYNPFAGKPRQSPILGTECYALAHLPYRAYPARPEAA